LRVDLIEKLVTALSAVTILVVAACVTFFSIVQKSSGIDSSVELTAVDTSKWLADQRSLARGEQAGPTIIPVPPMAPAPGAPGGVAAASGAKPGEQGKPAAPGKKDEYFDAAGNIPKTEQVPGIPWVRQQPGVVYYRPEGVPQIVAQKYTSFDDAWSLAQEGGGEFVQTDRGPAYKIRWIDENSMLRKIGGLQSDDVVISVNGHPVGNSFASGKQMYDQLKGEKRFAVKVLRHGQEVVLSYYVN
jgi:hypothetical protein